MISGSSPLMPRAVTPWLTAFNAYSLILKSAPGAWIVIRNPEWALMYVTIRDQRTYLNQLSTILNQHKLWLSGVCCACNVRRRWRAYLGEKVVNEKEYLSAMMTAYAGGFPAVTSTINRGRGELRTVYGVEKGGWLSCVVVAGCLETSYETGSSGRELAKRA